MRTWNLKTWILAGALLGAFMGSAVAQDAAFRKWCLPCHDAGDGAKIKLGPPLNGLDGRHAGTFANFNYSDAMKGSGITWNEASFKDYIRNPMQKVQGTRMAFAGVKDDNEVNELWNYLKAFDAEGKKK